MKVKIDKKKDTTRSKNLHPNPKTFLNIDAYFVGEVIVLLPTCQKI